MVSKRYQRKSERIEKIANESFKRFSHASWVLDLAQGDELDSPKPETVQEQLRNAFYAAGERVSQSTLRVNLRNIASRFALGRITKDQIAEKCALVRQMEATR